MRRMSLPNFLFHVTTKKSWGKQVQLTPRKTGKNRAIGEPEIKRICVAPTISRCFIAIPYEETETYYIYRTLRKVQGYYPYDVFDSRITREKWLISPISFIKIGVVPNHLLKLFPEESNLEYEKQRKSLKVIREILKSNTDIDHRYI